MKDMKGVISSERLAIAFNDKTSTNEINCLLKSYLMTQMYKLSQIFELNVEKKIFSHSKNKLTQLIRQSKLFKT